MVKAVIFDMYETLITLFESKSYFGTEIAKDLSIEENNFLEMWNSMEEERTIGKVSLEQALEVIMRKNQCYDMGLLNRVIEKRISAQKECYNHLHSEIILVLSHLKEQNIKIGLISNCFSEEAIIIRQSKLFPFFDGVYLSYEQGIQKPDKEIFRRCMTELDVLPEECLYVGDGGSFELEASQELGMKALQATWYLKEEARQPAKRKPNFVQLETPMELRLHISGK